MNREQFMRKFDKEVLSFGGRKPSLLLHSCCGPCSGSVIELLCKYFDVTVLWYNPNLWPESEYEKRLMTLKKLMGCLEGDGLGNASLVVLPWRSEDYFSQIEGLENEPEEGKRCEKCFAIRLEETAAYAASHGFEYFCTTLTVSSRKDAVIINAIGRDCAARHGVKWLPSEFRKREGNHRSMILAEKYELYRQKYCGCVFSFNHGGSDDE